MLQKVGKYQITNINELKTVNVNVNVRPETAPNRTNSFLMEQGMLFFIFSSRLRLMKIRRLYLLILLVQHQ